MNIRTSLLWASLGALPLLASGPLGAAPLMNGPVAQAPRAAAAVVAQLSARRALLGLDADHHFVVAALHPGVQGTQVIRASHTYKGLRVFGSESVVVSDQFGRIVSESSSERRQHLGRGSANRIGTPTADFDVTPVIGAQEAIRVALASVWCGRASAGN